MRDASIAVLREIGVETGGSNVQFAVNPADGRLVVIEMNPRVSRSSALASKATGFPIAKVAAKLAVGYTLDEIANDITGGATPASFEPTIDYVVTKIPRFAFEKFPGAEPMLTTSMKSVGEAMAIGRTFQESLQKALRSLETGLTGLDEIAIEGLGARATTRTPSAPRSARRRPTGCSRSRRRCALGVDRRADPRRLPHRSVVPAPRSAALVDTEARDQGQGPAARRPARLRRLKAHGFLRRAPRPSSPAQCRRGGRRETAARSACGRCSSASTPARPNSPRRPPTCIRPTRRRSPARRPTRRAPSDRKKVIILGGGPEPHRPGHRVRLLLLPRRLRAQGGRLRDHHGQLQSGDGVDRLRHLRPALFRAADRRRRAGDHRHRARATARCTASSCSSAGRRRSSSPRRLSAAQVPILGTSPDAIDLAEDRDRFKTLLDKLEAAPAGERHRHASPAKRARDRRRDRLSGRDPARPTCWAAAPWRSCTTARSSTAMSRGCRRSRPAVRTGGLREAPAADRPLSVRRHRSRRRLPCRRQGHLHRRHHGAHRGGRHPFRRYRLLAAALLARRAEIDRRAGAADPRARARAQCRRPDERAVRHQGRRDLRAGGQSARLAHGAVRRQGDRRAGGQDRRAHHGRREPGELQPEAPRTYKHTRRSRRRCSRSPASPASIPCWARR